MRLLSVCLAVLGLLGMAQGFAAEIQVRVDDARGGPAVDAVVSLIPQDTSPIAGAPAADAAIKVIDQRDETFIPYVEVFRTGDSVVFRNSDSTRHHAYSFSPTKSFELVLRPGESSAAMALDRNGVAAVGCNIHDRMITYLYVSDAVWIARTGVSGAVRFSDLAPGNYQVRVWHPQLRPKQYDGVQQLVKAAASVTTHATFSLALVPDPRAAPDRERADY